MAAHSKMSISHHSSLLLVVCVLTIINCIAIVIIDKNIAKYIAGYMSIESYVKPVTIFFFATYLVLYFGVKYGWKKMQPYLIVATTIFFPLIFITAVTDILGGLPIDIHQYYALQYCDGNTDPLLCGPALAHMVFSMTMTALPLLVMTPAIFFGLVKINFANLQDMHELN